MKRRLQIIVLLALWPLLVGAWWPWFQLGNNLLDPRGSRSAGSFSGSSSAWNNWDETTEDGLASANIFVVRAENVAAGGDETGQGGGLAGADLVLTQAGNVAGMVNDRRFMDGTDDAFSMTQNAVQTLLQGVPTWTIIAKIRTVSPADTNGPYVRFKEAGNTEIQFYHTAADNSLKISMVDSDTVEEVQTLGGVADARTMYMFAACNGTETRCGWAVSGSGAVGQPVKWSDFLAARRAVFAGLYENFGTCATERYVGRNSAAGLYLSFRWIYLVIASGECLIDFNS